MSSSSIHQPLIGGASSSPENGCACLDPSSSKYRYVVLIAVCLLTFGSYYCFDMPTVLENYIEDQVVSSFTTSVSTYYNLFYTIYAWTNMFMSLIAGVLVDRYGTKFSMYLFLGLCLTGSSLFALGATLVNSSGSTRYILMFAGRFIFGLGGGSITVVQNTITAKWFKGRELAFAFGCTLTISRIGSVINYDATSLVYDAAEGAHPNYGLGITLWVGVALVLLSYLAAMSIVFLEAKAESAVQYQQLASQEDSDSKEKGVVPVKPPMRSFSFREFFSDMKVMPRTFWIVCLIITFFYNLVFPWNAISVDFIKSNYGSHPNEWASWRASMVYMVSMIVSPFMGAAVDFFGRRDYLTIFGTALSIPVFILLSNNAIEPVIPLLMLGISYSVCAAALWPTLQLLVEQKMVGRANGIATSMQMLGIGICNIVVGRLKDANKMSNPNSPPCCAIEGNSGACFDTAFTGTCQPSKFGRCGDVSVDDVDYSNSCEGTNYNPMLHFFVGMACVALFFACILKYMDISDRALYIGYRDKRAAFNAKYSKDPVSPEEMIEATNLAKAHIVGLSNLTTVLGTSGALSGNGGGNPLLDDIT